MGSLRETNPSLWVGTSPVTAYPRLGGDRRVDVAVVGGGVVGLTTAHLLRDAGASVAVLEAGRIAAGTTGYTTAKVTSLQGTTYSSLTERHGAGKARLYADANEAGLRLVRALVDQLGIECDLTTQASYTYTEDPGQVQAIADEAAAAQSAGLPAEFVTDTGLPWPVEAAVRLGDQAQFHPRRYCQGLARAVVEAGGEVFEHTRVLDVDDGSPCRVETEHGVVTADHVVVATLLPFWDPGGYFAKAHPSRSYVIAVRAAEPVEGMYLSAGSPTRSIRTAEGGEWLVLGGDSHHVGSEEETGGYYTDLEEWARQRFTVDEVGYRWSSQDYVPVDGVPYAGRSARAERVWVVTGLRKWGFGNGSAAAMLLRDSILGRENPWTELYDAARADVVRSATTFIKENAKVAGHLVGDRLANLVPPGPDTIEPGDGGICRLDGDTVAAFRDDDGTLHAVSPACTHLGCLVRFNRAERSWDCPCHGSRFGTDGRVLQGPAVKDLERKR